MPNAYYTCNLLPLDLVAACGYAPRWVGGHLQDPAAPARRDALSIHPMTCPYVTGLVAAADVLLDRGPEDVLVVPGGCDAMRRMGDLLAATYPDRVFVLSLPRAAGEAETAALADGLGRLERWLRDHGAQPGDDEAGATPSRAATPSLPAAPPVEADGSPHVDYPSAPRPGGVFVVAGPLSDDALLRLIGQLGAHVSGLESCTSPDRWRPLAAVGRAARSGDDPSRQVALAREVLSLGMCPRRSTTERRDYLARRLDEAHPSSVIYARQSFCDPGAYDALLVAQLAEERGLPYLEIEVGFPFEPSGPLRTRVEAFLEAQLLDDDLLDDLLDGGDLFGGDLNGED
jgi:hypothetical protein